MSKMKRILKAIFNPPSNPSAICQEKISVKKLTKILPKKPPAPVPETYSATALLNWWAGISSLIYVTAIAGKPLTKIPCKALITKNVSKFGLNGSNRLRIDEINNETTINGFLPYKFEIAGTNKRLNAIKIVEIDIAKPAVVALK